MAIEQENKVRALQVGLFMVVRSCLDHVVSIETLPAFLAQTVIFALVNSS